MTTKKPTAWSTPKTLKAQVQRLWQRGVLLSAVTDEEAHFPLRLTLKSPSSRELSEQFNAAQAWIDALQQAAKYYRIDWRQIKHRVLGENAIPVAIWVTCLEDALAWIGKQQSAQQFRQMLTQTQARQPELLAWLQRYPLRGLDLYKDWEKLLAVVAWRLAHPHPRIYLRQIDIVGIHSKWIESHRGVLAELFDIVLPAENINDHYRGVGGFCLRYGFMDKPTHIRFRLLDANIKLLPLSEGSLSPPNQDITLTQQDFSALKLDIDSVFITENEINFLTFPAVTKAIVIFGAGYGCDALGKVAWLEKKHLYYWGDIDTHGFAILSQLRGYFPHTTAFLMDEATLLAHKNQWGHESKPSSAILENLSEGENVLYQRLQNNHYGKNLRLEQERIGFEFLQDFIAHQEGFTKLAERVDSKAYAR